MRKNGVILFCLTGLLLQGPVVFPQEREKPVVESSEDELGNVTDQFQELFFEALKQKAIENYDKAVDALLKALAADPQQSVVYLELGKNFNALEKYAQAANYLEKGRNSAPGNQAMLEELYNTYFLSREYDLALPVVRELSALDGSYSEDLVNLLILNEKYEEALSLLDSLDQKKGSNTYRESLRRQVYARTNNVEAQVSDLEEQIEKNPENEQDYLNLIFVYSENGEVDKAFETAQKLLEENPDSELVHLALYKFYITENAPEKAVNSMKILLGSDQIDEVTKYQALNDFLLYVTENPELEEDLIKLVVVFSEEENNTEVYKQLGTFFLEKGKNEIALEYFMTAIQNNKDDFGLFRKVLLLQEEQGNFAEVAKLSSQALEIFPSQPWLYLINGKALNALEKYKDAVDILSAGLDFLIDDTGMEKEFYLQLSEAYSALNNLKKAAEYQTKAENIKI